MPDKPLDFSIWHPLDHHFWEPRCRQFYGGWRRHLELAWQYGHGWDSRWGLEHPFYVLVLCRLGRHKLETWYVSRSRRYFTACGHCDFERKAHPDEWFDVSDLP